MLHLDIIEMILHHQTDIQIFTTRPTKLLQTIQLLLQNKINDAVLSSTETFNKSIEIAQKYYNDSIQNYFNFLKKIEKFSSNQ